MSASGERRPGGPIDLAALAQAIAAGDRTALARGITLVESSRETDQERAWELLQSLQQARSGTEATHRIGISGPPGVGKSTLIDALGLELIERGHRVAVLAIDPSSSRSGGSILGDKSRMDRLAQAEAAYIRPSPSDLALGGVTRRTREAMFLCEAAGFDRVLVETVGVGQSETEVAGMVDTFLVLVQPGSGDELQGIKKGIVELADVLAVNKADGDQAGAARETEAEYSSALRYLRPEDPHWQPRTLRVSARTGDGVAELVAALADHRSAALESGAFELRRRSDVERWIRHLAEERVLARFRADSEARARLQAAADRVSDGLQQAGDAARDVAG